MCLLLTVVYRKAEQAKFYVLASDWFYLHAVHEHEDSLDTNEVYLAWKEKDHVVPPEESEHHEPVKNFFTAITKANQQKRQK